MMCFTLISHLYSAVGDVAAWDDSVRAIEQCRHQSSGMMFPGADAQLLEQHLRGATSIHRRILATSSRLRSAEAALDRCGHAIFVLGPALEIVLLNRTAEHLLGRHEGLSRSGSTVVAETHAATRELRAAVSAVGAEATTVMLPRKTDPALTAVLAAGGVGEPGGDRHVIMFVVDPACARERSGELFSRLYGFTRTEAEVALLLMLGCSIQEVTERQQISLHTARTHLKRLLLKTDTNRQGELVMFLLTSPAVLMRQAV
jgi:DNA-binding CsgD family transcriptional regulator